MTRTTGRIHRFRGSRTGRNRPLIEPNLREKVLDQIYNELYKPHWRFWNQKLQALADENAGYHGRTAAVWKQITSAISEVCNVGIFYASQAWFVPSVWQREASDFDIIPLHPDYPKLEVDAIKITSNLSELDIETYEVRRFLAGLMLFPAPSEVMKELLGSALYSRVGQFYEELSSENSKHVWNDSVTKAFHSYAKEHDYLINAMCQRVMMNLITRDAFAAR